MEIVMALNNDQMLALGLITDKTKLFKSIDQTARLRTKLESAYHINAVSALLHLSIHGQIDVLNKFYNSLNAAHQTNFRVYVNYLCGEGSTSKSLPEGAGWIAPTTGAEKKGGAFKIINGRMDQRAEFTNKIENVFRNDKMELGGVERKPEFFYKLKVTASDLTVIADEDVMKRVDAMVKGLTKDDTDRKQTKVSPAILAALQTAQAEIAKLVAAGNPGAGNLQ